MRAFPKGTFVAQRRHPLKGRVLNAIYDALRARTPVAGNGVQLREVDGGFQIHAGVEIPETGGAFNHLYTGENGRTYLQGGTLTIAGTCAVIPDYWVVDPVTGPRGAEGDTLVLQVYVTGYLADGVLLPGLEMVGTPSMVSPGTGNPPIYPKQKDVTPAEPVELKLGRYTEDGFGEMQAGHRSLHFSPGYISPGEPQYLVNIGP